MLRHYLLDTNHAGEIYKKTGKYQRPPSVDPRSRFSLCYTTVGELWYMVHNSRFRFQNAATLRTFLSNFDILFFDAKAAEAYGVIQTEVIKIGRTIKPLDIQIAATARVHGLTVLTADKHFSYVAGISVENWLTR